MDETLMHCVDDAEQDNSDVILELDFNAQTGSDSRDILYAGINLRPFALECLKEAKKDF